MGLLAGEKRKQKIGLDPNNLTWAKDTSSVGQSMLKKMGWKEGAGLGANEDGRVVPVKASMKCNTAGLGCSAQQADSWIAHGVEFDQILASLNASTKTESSINDANSEKPPEDEMEGQRRFYGRFSRGGVKRTRTAEDLNCIFGRRKVPTRAPDDSEEETDPEKNNDSSEDKNESQDNCVDKSHGVETVTSNYSVQDYFAQKLKKLKEKKENVEDAHTVETAIDEHDDGKQDTEPEIQDFNSYVTSSFSVNDYFSRKMKVKNEKLAAAADDKSAEDKECDCEKENSLSIDCPNADVNTVPDLGEERDQIDIKMKKKKKKKRKAEDVEISVENSPYDENNCTSAAHTEEKKEKKKKKKRKHEDVEIQNDDDSSSYNNISSFEVTTEKKKKKKKRKTEDVELSNDDSDLVVDNNRAEEKSEKKKRKKEGKTEDAIQVCDEDSVLSESTDVICTDENIKEKKKKKKRKSEI